MNDTIKSELQILSAPELLSLCRNFGLTSRQTKIIMCRINKKLYLPETSEEVGASISTIKRDTIIALKRISSYKRFCLQNTMN